MHLLLYVEGFLEVSRFPLCYLFPVFSFVFFIFEDGAREGILGKNFFTYNNREEDLLMKPGLLPWV